MLGQHLNPDDTHRIEISPPGTQSVACATEWHMRHFVCQRNITLSTLILIMFRLTCSVRLISLRRKVHVLLFHVFSYAAWWKISGRNNTRKRRDCIIWLWVIFPPATIKMTIMTSPLSFCRGGGGWFGGAWGSPPHGIAVYGSSASIDPGSVCRLR